MDLATILGLIVAFGSILLSLIIEGGEVSAFVNLPAFVLVLGGTLGATIIGLPFKQVSTTPTVLKQAFFTKPLSPAEVMTTIVEFSRKARREGVLALENDLKGIRIPFIRRGIQLVIDGTSPELVREMLETELASMQARHKGGISVFEAMGGFAPTLGILGTVMGLVHMLANLSDPKGMGEAIAAAFIATLYGVGSANLVFLPIGNKLKAKSAEEARTYELAIEGILSLQSGANARVVASKMQSFLAPKLREKALAKGQD